MVSLGQFYIETRLRGPHPSTPQPRIMADAPQDTTEPSVRFKRRKTTHTKRTNADDDGALGPQPRSINATEDTALTPQLAPADQDREDTVPNLKDIIRNRRRPRDRFKETTRKIEPTSTEIAQVDAPRPGQYTDRFVAQTGQVVDQDDTQM